MDVVIPIVFPDYLIHVSTQPVRIDVPDLVPYFDIFPDYVRIPGSTHKLSELGHAGVLFINGVNGLTKYFEYGRYDQAAVGLVRRIPIPDVKIGPRKSPSEESLMRVLSAVSRKAGQNGRIEGAYAEVHTGRFVEMLRYAQKRARENRNPRRTTYSLTGNNCMHFVKSVAEAGGAKMPWVVDPRPVSFIVEVQTLHPRLTFAPPRLLRIYQTD